MNWTNESPTQTCLIWPWSEWPGFAGTTDAQTINNNEFDDTTTNGLNLDDIDLSELTELDFGAELAEFNDELLLPDKVSEELFKVVNEIETLVGSGADSGSEYESSVTSATSPARDWNEMTSESSMSSFEEAAATARSKKTTSARDRVLAGRVDKKESNKAAAVRYRSKKSKEKDQLFAECEMYERRNSEMKIKIESVEAEITCIKKLLVEALIAKTASV